MLLGGDTVQFVMQILHEVLGNLTGNEVEARAGHIRPLNRSQMGLLA